MNGYKKTHFCIIFLCLLGSCELFNGNSSEEGGGEYCLVAVDNGYMVNLGALRLSACVLLSNTLKMIFKKLAFIALFLLLGSCATYQPASEGIIYHDHDKPYAVKRAFPFPYGEGGTTISPVILPGTLRNKIRRHYESDAQRFEGKTIVFREEYLIAAPVYAISVPLAHKAALGISGFPAYPGFDATVHLFEDTWLTGSIQFPFFLLTNTEFILQRPVHRVENGGVSVGLFYRYEHLNFYREGERISLYDLVPLHFPIEWMGSRVAWQIPRQFLDTRFRLYFNGGYSTTYDSALFMIGIGFYSRPSPRRRRLTTPPPF